MPLERGDIGDIRIDDLRTLIVVERTGSLAAAARQFAVSPSRVSKVIARLELRLGIALVTRNSRGIELTEAGQRLLPEIHGLIEKCGNLVTRDASAVIDLTFAAEPYIVTLTHPVIAAVDPRLRVRGLELTSPAILSRLSDNSFDMALLPRAIERPPIAWGTESIGRMRKGLFANAVTTERLGPSPISADRLRDERFVSPTTLDTGLTTLLEDDCPLRPFDRLVGHQTETMSVGLEVAARTGQLVFGPVALARPFLASGRLREIEVVGWNVFAELLLVFHTERVLARIRDAIVTGLRLAIAELPEVSRSSPDRGGDRA